MLRVSSYARLFDGDNWGRHGGLRAQRARQYQASDRAAATDACDCDKFNFAAAKALNKESLNQFFQDRTTMAALNNRLVCLIELARCFEEENYSLKWQIRELKEKLSRRRPSTAAESDYDLGAVVKRLRRERDEILQDTEKLQKELERLMKEYEKAAQQRIVLQQERNDAAEEVDAVTAGCLALREQVTIYEEQLANMEAQHKTAVESVLGPAEAATRAAAAIKSDGPDITPALDVKEYYCRLAERLQGGCGAVSAAVVCVGDGKQAVGSTIKDGLMTEDIGYMKMLITELQKELATHGKCNEELEGAVEMKAAAYTDEIASLELIIDELKQQEADLQKQIKEQCDDYKELLSEKMARHVEITAYRCLVEEEEGRLCNL